MQLTQQKDYPTLDSYEIQESNKPKCKGSRSATREEILHVLCFYHSADLDGKMSAAIVNHYYGQNKQGKLFLDVHNVGWNHGDPIPTIETVRDNDYDVIVMCDITFHKSYMEELDKLTHFIWIDHHKSAIEDNKDIELHGLRSVNMAACELAWRYFFKTEASTLVKRLSLYDIGAANNLPKEEGIAIKEFQLGARYYLKDHSDCFMQLERHLNDGSELTKMESMGKVLFEDLKTRTLNTLKNCFNISICESTATGTKYRLFKAVNAERFNPMLADINYHVDGVEGFCAFWFDGKEWAFSLYNEDGTVDCSAIAKGYNGGGHKGAAGFRLSPNEFTFFINRARS